ncbi:hypothetical protein RLOC_00006834 [Lonchura striata]|uniref:Uncharacterized protein n=2 Tax=Lonchura striata TaxID=40157 RepID=A0A218UDR3_9PASE|nr:hypothetical protein RLOC_00006834 [Lonchura striata domestica]
MHKPPEAAAAAPAVLAGGTALLPEPLAETLPSPAPGLPGSLLLAMAGAWGTSSGAEPGWEGVPRAPRSLWRGQN